MAETAVCRHYGGS